MLWCHTPAPVLVYKNPVFSVSNRNRRCIACKSIEQSYGMMLSLRLNLQCIHLIDPDRRIAETPVHNAVHRWILVFRRRLSPFQRWAYASQRIVCIATCWVVVRRIVWFPVRFCRCDVIPIALWHFSRVAPFLHRSLGNCCHAIPCIVPRRSSEWWIFCLAMTLTGRHHLRSVWIVRRGSGRWLDWFRRIRLNSKEKCRDVMTMNDNSRCWYALPIRPSYVNWVASTLIKSIDRSININWSIDPLPELTITGSSRPNDFVNCHTFCATVPIPFAFGIRPYSFCKDTRALAAKWMLVGSPSTWTSL